LLNFYRHPFSLLIPAFITPLQFISRIGQGPIPVAARNDTKEQAGDRDSGTVIDPARLIDHEALSRVREIARALPHENEAGHQKNDRHDNQELAHT